MPFTTLYQCTDCGWTGNHYSEHEDCPKRPEREAENAAWQAAFDRRTKVWEDWQAEHAPNIEHAYPSVDHDPTEIAVHGQCVLYLPYDEFWASGPNNERAYTSKVLTDPTWGEVLICFEEAIKCTGDYHHTFLEGLIVPEEPEGEVAHIEFSTGS